MRGARVAVDAAVLAAAIGVDRAVEGDVGAVVARDDGARRLLVHLGLEGIEIAEALPAVVERVAPLGFEAAGMIGARAASAPALGRDALVGRLLRLLPLRRSCSLRLKHSSAPNAQSDAIGLRRTKQERRPERPRRRAFLLLHAPAAVAQRAMISVVIPALDAEAVSARHPIGAHSSHRRGHRTPGDRRRRGLHGPHARDRGCGRRRGSHREPEPRRPAYRRGGARQASLALVPARRHHPRSRLGARGRALHGAGRYRAAEACGSRLPLRARRRGAGAALPRGPRRAALRSAAFTLWRPGAAHSAPAL